MKVIVASMKANHVENGEFVDEEQVHLSLRTPWSCPILGDALYGNASTTFLSKYALTYSTFFTVYVWNDVLVYLKPNRYKFNYLIFISIILFTNKIGRYSFASILISTM